MSTTDSHAQICRHYHYARDSYCIGLSFCVKVHICIEKIIQVSTSILVEITLTRPYTLIGAFITYAYPVWMDYGVCHLLFLIGREYEVDRLYIKTIPPSFVYIPTARVKIYVSFKQQIVGRVFRFVSLSILVVNFLEKQTY